MALDDGQRECAIVRHCPPEAPNGKPGEETVRGGGFVERDSARAIFMRERFVADARAGVVSSGREDVNAWTDDGVIVW